MYYSGIDLHKRYMDITTIDENNEIVDHLRIRNDAGALLRYYQNYGLQIEIVVEATFNWYWVVDTLESQGFHIILAHPKRLRAICSAKVNTDKISSLTLAQLLRLRMIPVVYRIDRKSRSLRDFIRERMFLVQKRTSLINHIHAVLNKYNIPLLYGKELNTKDNLAWIEQLQFDPLYHFTLRLHVENIRTLNRQIAEIEKIICQNFRVNEDINRLMTVPGIGPILAALILFEIGDIRRFPDVKHFFSYCRLVTSVHSSGGKTRYGKTSKEGNPYLKWAFCEAVLNAIKQDAWIRSYYHRVSRKKGEKVARIIVAKELARIVFYVLLRKTVYTGFGKPVQALSGKPVARPGER